MKSVFVEENVAGDFGDPNGRISGENFLADVVGVVVCGIPRLAAAGEERGVRRRALDIPHHGARIQRIDEEDKIRLAVVDRRAEEGKGGNGKRIVVTVAA